MIGFDVREYVLGALNGAREVAARHSGEVTAECPSCDAAPGKFYVNAESGRFLCNKCGFSGRSVIPLVAKLEGVSDAEARQFVFARAVKLPRKSELWTLKDRLRDLRREAEGEAAAKAPVDSELPRAFVPCYNEASARWNLPPYLKVRGIRSATARAWGLGWCLSGYYADRLVIPFECPAGKSWTARAMHKKVFGDKYLNPRGADHRRMLIGWNVLRTGGELVLCEGPLDAVRLWQWNLSALAFGGKVIHEEQMAQLSVFPRDTTIIIMLDPEERLAPHSVAEALSARFRSLYVARLPDGVDPGDSTEEQAHDAVLCARSWRGGRTPRLAARLSLARERLETRFSSSKSKKI